MSWQTDLNSSLKHLMKPATCKEILILRLTPERTIVNVLLHRCYEARINLRRKKGNVFLKRSMYESWMNIPHCYIYLNHFECVKILLWQQISWCHLEAVEGTLKLSSYWRMSYLMCMGPLRSSSKILHSWRGCLRKITLHAVFGYFSTITLLRRNLSMN